MGRLKQLELENFKSYHGHHVVGPFDDFTCIIGPNGAGKSNMMDAISFVLGVQSKHLRSSHLKELIFKSDSLTDTVPRKASVKLVYEVSENEIDDIQEGNELIFTRLISSSGISTYKIGKKDVSYETYEETLQKIGVLVKARNFLVFQGDVESVASKSPVDLSKLLEQISGSDRFKDEYEELIAKKETSDESISYLLQKKKMFISQCKEVKQQKDEAEKYQSQKDDIDKLNTDHFLLQIWMNQEARSEHMETINELRESSEDVQARENSVDAKILTEKKEIARVNKNLTAIEKEHANKIKQSDNNKSSLHDITTKLKSLNKRMKEYVTNESDLNKDRNDQLNSIEKLQTELAALEKQDQELETEIGEGSTSIMNPQKVKEYSTLREKVSSRTATQKAELLTVEQEVVSKRLYIQRQEFSEKSISQEIESSNWLMNEYEERIKKLNSAIKEGTNEKDNLRSTRDKIANDMKLNEEKFVRLSEELEEINEKLREVGDDRRRNKNEERILEAIETMKRIFTGVHGRLVDLCHPIQKKYSQAIAVAAGKHMDAIVVDTKAAATDCIRYLKDQRIGTCTFLPLNGITVSPIPDRLRNNLNLGGGNNPNRYKLCADLIECDEKFSSVINYAVGSTVVCESLEDAQELCFQRGERIKAVTLQGNVISKTGAMTGGILATSRDQQDRWEAKDVEKLRKRKTEIEETLAKIKQETPTRQHLLDMETKFKSLQTKIQYSDADCKVAEEKLGQLKQQKVLKEELLKQHRSEVEVVTSEVSELQNRLAILQDSIRSVESEVFAAFSKSVGVVNIREYEDNRLKDYQAAVNKRKELSERRAAITSQLDYESKRDFVSAIKRVKDQITKLEKDIQNLQQDEEKIQKKNETLQSELSKLQSNIASCKNEIKSLNSNYKTLASDKSSIVNEKESILKKISGEEILIERLRSSLHEILQKAQVEEISLPTVDGEEESSIEGDDLIWLGSSSQTKTQQRSSRASSRSSRAESETQSTHFSESDNRVVTKDQKKVSRIDLSSLKKYKNFSKNQITDVENQLIKGIKRLSQELETMQPNMHATERYQTLMDKANECNTELETVKTAAQEVSSRFDQVKETRQQLFNECYRHVSETLTVIYKDLTRSSRHPVGGNAYLTLDNTDEPYLGGVRFTAMPPMKRFRDMEQLSGGEKTIAALALLFSIHNYRQAPFFVLDEVDAALDNVNVRKVCNYIQQRSKDFQCIVISLKDMFFDKADSLVGICKDVDSLSSRILTLKLTDYPEETLPDGQKNLGLLPVDSNNGDKLSRTPQSTGSSVVSTSSRMSRKRSSEEE